MNKKERREIAIQKLMAYLPHITREQAEKHVDIEAEMDKKEITKRKAQRNALGWRN